MKERHEQHGERNHAGRHDEPDDPDRNVVLRAREFGRSGAALVTRRLNRRNQAFPDRNCELAERPQRRDPDRAGSDEAHLMRPHVRRDVGRAARHRMQRGQHGRGDAPRDDETGENGESDREPDQMTRTQQREREADADSGGRFSDAKERVEFPGEDARRDDRRERRGRDCAHHDRQESGFALGGAFARSGSDAQHFGRGNAFGIREIRIHDQSSPQRNRIHHAEHAPCRADAEALPERKAGPPADHDQSRQHEDDRGERSGGRRDRLDDVVLVDRRVLERTQQRHRDHRRRNGRRERQPDLETEIDVRSREDHGNRRAENQSADGELGARRIGLHGRILSIATTSTYAPSISPCSLKTPTSRKPTRR